MVPSLLLLLLLLLPPPLLLMPLLCFDDISCSTLCTLLLCICLFLLPSSALCCSKCISIRTTERHLCVRADVRIHAVDLDVYAFCMSVPYNKCLFRQCHCIQSQQRLFTTWDWTTNFGIYMQCSLQYFFFYNLGNGKLAILWRVFRIFWTIAVRKRKHVINSKKIFSFKIKTAHEQTLLHFILSFSPSIWTKCVYPYAIIWCT